MVVVLQAPSMVLPQRLLSEDETAAEPPPDDELKADVAPAKADVHDVREVFPSS
jgi:hypothetical protein